MGAFCAESCAHLVEVVLGKPEICALRFVRSLHIDMIYDASLPLHPPGDAIKAHQESTESCLGIGESEGCTMGRSSATAGPHELCIVLRPKDQFQNIRDLWYCQLGFHEHM